MRGVSRPFSAASVLLFTLLVANHAVTVTVPYSVKAEGQVSLAIYDQQGRLVRTLLTGAPRRPGQYVEVWDGCDRYGNPQPPGTYTWKLLETKGLVAEFLLQVGQNPRPPGARGVGNHGAPGSVVADESGVYFAGTTEGAHTFGKTDRAGRYLWTSNPAASNWGAHRGVALALLDGKLYELNGDGLMYGVTADTGQCFTDGQFMPKPWNLNRPGTTNSVTGHMDLAADPTNKLLVVSYRDHNALAWFDPAQRGKQIDELTGIEKPAGLAVKADGTVLLISQGAVWSLTRADKILKPVIAADKLQSPWRIDVNHATGEILVAENSDMAGGLRHHQVKKFSASGELLATYGRPEGRRDGSYIATDFRNINDVSFDPVGGFLVSEGPWTPPRRTVRLDDTGKVLHEWFGGQAYGTLATPEPDDPTHVWFYVNAPRASGLVRCQIDFATRSWKVVETYWDCFLDSPLGNITPNFLKITERAGKLYIYAGTRPALSVVVYDKDKRTLRPANHSARQDTLPREFVPEAYRGEWDSYIWNDLNDDGVATPDELVWMHRPPVGGYLDPGDFTLYLIGEASAFHDGYKITPRRFTPGGTPVYDWADAQPYNQKWQEDDVTLTANDLHHNADGTWFGCTAQPIPTPHEGWETHGEWYFNSCSGMDRLVKWDKNGKLLWSVGRHSPDAEADTGSTAMPRYLSGTTHGCVIWTDASDVETVGPKVWTEDGLYVDELWRLRADTANEDVYGLQTGNEYPTGRLYTDPKTGRVYYYMITCALGSTVYEIHGWDRWRRERGTVELKREPPPPISFTGTGLKAEYFNNLDLSGPPALTRTDGPVYFLWCTNAPAAKIHAGNFSVRWTGQVQAQTTEPYKFTVETTQHFLCDGPPEFVRIWVDDQPADGKWILLKRGEKYDIRVEAGWAKGTAVAKLCWETKTNDRRVILPKFLYPERGTTFPAVQAGQTRSLWFRAQRRGEILPGLLRLNWRGHLIAGNNLVAKGQFADNQWHHVVLVSGGPHEDQRLYVDGTLRAASPVGTAPRAIQPASSGAGIAVRDAQEFSRALHFLEIKDLYRRGVGLLAHVPLDDERGHQPRVTGAIPGLAAHIVGQVKWLPGALATQPTMLEPAYIMVGRELELPATDYTIAFQFKTDAPNAGLFCTRRRSPHNAIWEDHSLHLFGGKLRFALAGQDMIVTPHALNDGQWHQVVTTVGGETQDSRLYVDGKLIGTGKLAVRKRTSDRLGVDLGHATGGFAGAPTSFRDLRVYGRALTATEIQRLPTD